MKRIICKIFGHRWSSHRLDQYHTQWNCKRCWLKRDFYTIDVGEWSGIVASRGE